MLHEGDTAPVVRNEMKLPKHVYPRKRPGLRSTLRVFSVSRLSVEVFVIKVVPG